MKKLIVLIVIAIGFSYEAVSDAPRKSESEFTFARVQFTMDPRWIFDYREEPWHHDYPFGEDLYLSFLKEVTRVDATRESYQIVKLDSPDIFKYPFLYFSEPGYMELTSKEEKNLREFFDRGGFAMFDDFRGPALEHLRQQMKKVFPDREMFKLDVHHPIWNSFYEIKSLDMPPPYRNFDSGDPSFWGMNDDKGNLILIADADNDLGEFWEWVDKGQMPFQPAALSVRVGIDYLIYAMTH
jgi:Domain of unknown function (DUF4159)